MSIACERMPFSIGPTLRGVARYGIRIAENVFKRATSLILQKGWPDHRPGPPESSITTNSPLHLFELGPDLCNLAAEGTRKRGNAGRVAACTAAPSGHPRPR